MELAALPPGEDVQCTDAVRVALHEAGVDFVDLPVPAAEAEAMAGSLPPGVSGLPALSDDATQTAVGSTMGILAHLEQ